VCAISSLTSTFIISSPDEFLFILLFCMSILYVYCDCFTLRLTKFCYRILLLLTTMRPSPRSHASNVVEGETAVDRG